MKDPHLVLATIIMRAVLVYNGGQGNTRPRKCVLRKERQPRGNIIKRHELMLLNYTSKKLVNIGDNIN